MLGYRMSLWCSEHHVTTDSTVTWHSNYILFFLTKSVLLALLDPLIMVMHVYFCILEEKRREEGGGELCLKSENCERFLNFTYCSELKMTLCSSEEQ